MNKREIIIEFIEDFLNDISEHEYTKAYQVTGDMRTVQDDLKKLEEETNE